MLYVLYMHVYENKNHQKTIEQSRIYLAKQKLEIINKIKRRDKKNKLKKKNSQKQIFTQKLLISQQRRQWQWIRKRAVPTFQLVFVLPSKTPLKKKRFRLNFK